MSTKTLRKRIAVVAVSALAAGFLSIASAPVANAAALDGQLDSSTGSVGIVGAITPAIGTVATTHTAVLLSTGTLRLSTSGTSTLKVSAGARIDAVNTASSPSGTGTINGTQLCAEGLVDADFAVIKPTGAAGSTFSVTTYDEDTCASAATVVDVITVTIAGTSVAGVANAAQSSIRWDSDDTGSAPTAAEDVTNSETTTTNQLYLRINVEDAYGQDVASTSGALVVTASSGAYLGEIAGSGATTSAALAAVSTRVSTADPSPLWVRVGEATAGAGWSGTVTVTYNGVLLATKTGVITGAPSSISVQPYKIGRTGVTSAIDTHLYTVKDAAGNNLDFTSSDLALDTSSASAIVSGISAGAVNASSSSAYGAGVGSLKIVCTGTTGAAGGGTSNVVVKHTTSTGAVIKSNSFVATCGGDAYKFTASFDKASYIQGEVATLTVNFTDSKGNPANSTTKVGTGSGTTNDATISAPMMALVGTLGAGDDMKPNVKGQLTYKYTVGTATGLTSGSYNAVVSFPTLANADAVSVAYKVSTGGSNVTNEDVLKSIVSLIASINKQIQALQKLILRR